MNKTLVVLLFITSFIAYVHAANVTVNVGGPTGKNIFDPSTIVAMGGDNIIFTWISGKHSIIESDAPETCVKSVDPDAFSSGGAFLPPKTWSLQLPSGKGNRRLWFYCGVPGHCEVGMYGTIDITDSSIPVSSAPLPAPSPAPSGFASGKVAPSNSTVSGMPTTISNPSPNNMNNTNNTNNNSIMIGSIVGALAFGSLFTVGSFLFYKKFKNINRKRNIILVPADDNRNNSYNPEQIPNNRNNYNLGQIPDNRNNYNHGQEANPISENNDNLRDYIVQVVRQEITQNQSK